MSNVMNRRHLLAGLASSSLLSAAPEAFAAPAPADLGAVAANARILFGAALGSPYATDAKYAALFSQARLLVSEWQFKTGSLMPNPPASTTALRPGDFSFFNADGFINTAAALKKPVKAHCLFWQAANPAWLATLSTAELQYFFDAYIDIVIPRYAGRVYAWDVVNEPFWPADGLPGGFGDGPWYQAFGPGWVQRAFQRVSALDRTAMLCLNEAECDINVNGLGNTIRPALLQLIDTIRQAGVQLNAVGLQGHLRMDMAYDDSMFANFVGQVAQRGVEVWLSEIDVRENPSDVLNKNTSTRDQIVATRVGSFLSKSLANKSVTQVCTWGLSDKYSWLTEIWLQQNPGSTKRPRPLPYDTNMTKTPMWTAMSNAFSQRKLV